MADSKDSAANMKSAYADVTDLPITIEGISTKSSAGIIYIKTEDDVSRFRRRVARECSIIIDEWSAIGIYYVTSKIEVGLFDYWSGLGTTKLFRSVMSLDEIVKQAIVTKIMIIPLALKPDAVADSATAPSPTPKNNANIPSIENFKAVFLREYMQKPISLEIQYTKAYGKERVDRIIEDANIRTLFDKSQRYLLQIPDRSLSKFLQESDSIETNNVLLKNHASNDMIFRLLACETQLIKLITNNSDELQKLLVMMNTYRMFFGVPPLSFSNNTIEKQSEIQQDKDYTTMSDIELRKVIHLVHSLENSNLDQLETWLMMQLADKKP